MPETCVMAQCQMTKECKRRECVFHIRDEFDFPLPKYTGYAPEFFTEDQYKKLIEEGIGDTHYPKFRAYTGIDAIYVACEDVIL